MPPKIIRKRMYKRKNKFRKRSKRAPNYYTVNFSKSLKPFPPRTICKLKYADQQGLTTAVGNVPVAQLYNLNSLFDPDRTGAGHQPYGFDQLATIYGRYRVFKVSYRVIFRSVVATDRGMVGVALKNDATTLAGVNASLIQEYPRTRFKELDTTRGTTFVGHIYLPSLNGSSPAVYKADDRFQALVNASPTELMTLQNFYVNNISSGSVFIDTLLIFHCEFFDPLDIGQS